MAYVIAPQITVLSNGNVGIGEANPLQKLVVSDGAVGIEFVPAATNGTFVVQSFDRVAGTYEALRFDTTDSSGATMILDTAGKVGIGTVSPVVNADLTLEGGAIALRETTTPTADTNYGKFYTKSDNLAYFQDGAGVEHTLAFV